MTKTTLFVAAAMLAGTSSFAMAQQQPAQSLYDLSISGASIYEAPLQHVQAPRPAAGRQTATSAYASTPAVRTERTLTDTIIW